MTPYFDPIAKQQRKDTLGCAAIFFVIVVIIYLLFLLYY